jgi:hypothetical protein
MFTKSKNLKPPPKPPSIDEIMEDLETFEVARPPIPTTRKLELADDDADFDDWWKVFETFVQDLKDFKELKVNLNELKTKIEEKNSQLTQEIEDTKMKIDENIIKIDLQIS